MNYSEVIQFAHKLDVEEFVLLLKELKVTFAHRGEGFNKDGKIKGTFLIFNYNEGDGFFAFCEGKETHVFGKAEKYKGTLKDYKREYNYILKDERFGEKIYV